MNRFGCTFTLVCDWYIHDKGSWATKTKAPIIIFEIEKLEINKLYRSNWRLAEQCHEAIILELMLILNMPIMRVIVQLQWINAHNTTWSLELSGSMCPYYASIRTEGSKKCIGKSMCHVLVSILNDIMLKKLSWCNSPAFRLPRVKFLKLSFAIK